MMRWSSSTRGDTGTLGLGAWMGIGSGRLEKTALSL
jgi:hypothetical protein